MAVQGDRGLTWDARIDLSKFVLDAKNIDKILSQLGANGIDSTALEAAIKEVGQTAVKTQKDVVTQVEQASKQMNLSLVQEAQKAQKTLQGKGVTTILPEGFVQTEKQKIEQVVDFSKEQLKELQAAVDQYGISAIQTQGKSVPRPTKGAAGTMSTILGENLEQTLSQAKTAFAGLDDQTKQYVLDLVDMQTALNQVETAQKRLTAGFTAGKIDQKEYSTATAALTKAQENLKGEIKNLNTVQQTSLGIQDLQTNTLNERKEAVKALKTAYGNLTDAEQADTEIGGKMKAQIADLTTQIKQQSQITEKGVGIITEYRQLRNKIASDQANGIFNQEDITRAATLEHSIRNVNRQLKLSGSNTPAIDALSQGVQGLVGAFTAASGVIGLFTDDNEKAQQVIRVTTSAMATLMGVQQLMQVLNKNSAVNAYIRGLIQKKIATQADTVAQQANNVATVENTVAEGANVAMKEADTVATVEATAAQWSLNAAMEANPIGILILALTAVVGAIAYFSESTDAAAKKQTKLNETLAKGNQLLRDMADLQSQPYKDAVTAAEQQLSLAKATGKSGAELESYYKKLDDAKLHLNGFKQGSEQLVRYQGEILKTTGEMSAAIESLDNQIRDAQRNKASDKQIAALEAKLKPIQDSYNYLHSLEEDNLSIRNEAEVRAAQLQKESNEKALASDTDYWKSKVTLAKEGTKAWLDAQLKLNAATYTKTASTPGVTAGQISLASATKLKADLEANRKYNDQVLKDQADSIQARMDKVRQGSAEELNLKLQLLDNQKKAEINNAKENAALIEKINADSQKKQDDLKKSYEKEQISRLLDLQANFAKEQLANLSPDSDSFLAYTKQIQNISAQNQTKTALDAAAKANPLINTKLVDDALTINGENYLDYAKQIEKIDSDLAQKIRAIWAETNNKNLNSDNAFINNLLRNKNKIVDIQASIAKEANNAIINNPNSSQIAVSGANLRNNKIDISATQDKLKNLTDSLKQNYASIGDSVSKYVLQVSDDFNKIKELNNPDSDISHILDGIKDPAAKENLQELLTLLHSLGVQNKELQKQNLASVFAGVGDIANSLSAIGSSIGDINQGFADTLETMGEMVQAASDVGQGVAQIASGDVVGGIASVFKGVAGIFSIGAKARESERKANAELAEFQRGLITGQIQYNQYLREQLNIQSGLVDGTFAQLAAQRQLTQEKQRGVESDLKSARAFLEASGQQITGEYTKKYGGFLGIGKKTKVVQQFGSLGITKEMSDQQIADQLKLLELQNKLTGATKEYADLFISANDEAKALGTTLEDLNEQIGEAFAGSTADSIAQSIVDGLKAGKRSFEDFSDDINTILSNSIFASIKDSLVSGPVKKIMEQFLSDFNQNDGGMLTANEISVLQDQLKQAIEYGTDAYEAALKAFPELNSASNTANGLTSQIKGVTQDQASELAGLYRNNLDQTKNILKANQGILSSVNESKVLLNQQLTYLQNIDRNTADTVNRLDITNKKLDQVITNTKQPNLRDLG